MNISIGTGIGIMTVRLLFIIRFGICFWHSNDCDVVFRRNRALSRLALKKLEQDSEKEKFALESALRTERLRAVEVRHCCMCWHFLIPGLGY
jgi:hypothetical protein